MKKQIILLMIAGALLTACGKEEPAAEAEKNVTAEIPEDTAVEQEEDNENTIEEDTKEKEEISETSKAAEETPDAGMEKPDPQEAVKNEFFSACLKEFAVPEDEEEMVTVIFEFTNITDKTYYKNDEEIAAGRSWEKNIFYTKKKWADLAGTECWIHYDLYEDADDQQQIYKGGLKFTVADDLTVADIETFED